METLIKRRGIIKGKLTRQNNANISEIDEFEAETRLESLSMIENEFEEVQVQIELLAKDEDVATHEAERQQFETTMLNLRSQLRKRRHQLAPAPSTPASSIASTSRSLSAEQLPAPATHRHDPAVKMPKITIPTFTGNWDEWTRFRDLFTALVHKSTITDAEKLFFLTSSVDKTALGTIQLESFDGKYYEEAWNSLRNRYENPRLIINHHVSQLFSLPMANTDNAIRPLLDAFFKRVRALRAQGLPTDQWDALLVYLIGTKLGQGIRRQWETSLEDATKTPTLEQFTKFLEKRAAAAEIIGQGVTQQREINPQNAPKREVRYSHLTKTESCPFCKNSHFAYQCPTYQKASISEREKMILSHRLCKNCLNPRHQAAQCRSTKCKKCNSLHHTSLHQPTPKEPTATPSSSSVTLTAIADAHTILPTAYVKATNGNCEKPVRMVIDCASQCTLISERLARKLQLRTKRINHRMEGIGGSIAKSPQFSTSLTIKAHHTFFELKITAKILPFITAYKPHLNHEALSLIRSLGIPLADNFENLETEIDLLLGSEYWAQIMQPGKLEAAPDLPPLLNSSFGWLISGNFSIDVPSETNEHCFLTIEHQLRQFWELEEGILTSQRKLSDEEAYCEQLFEETTTRDQSGRYIVKLPFNERISELGDSRVNAERQFFQIEKRMNRDPKYHQHYETFLREYEELGHMTQVNKIAEPNYFLPHHAVIRPDDESKFRVVFNGSKPTSTGVSLNQALHVGPTIQSDLFSILARFRLHKVAIVADIEKMYRQILVHPDHRQFQMVCWRPNPLEKLRYYELNTITYGLACAPYLAIRCVRQLAIDAEKRYPVAARALLEDDYVDDVVSGANSTAEAIELIDQLDSLAASGQLKLRKWQSNDPSILSYVNEPGKLKNYSFDDGKYTKTLGLLWETISDEFTFTAEFHHLNSRLTKRQLLSEFSQIFDPLGLLAPIVIIAKCILQQLWLLPMSWDTPVPTEVRQQYLNFHKSMSFLPQIRIPRYLNTEPTIRMALHGFSDASENAYAACVYLTITYENGTSISSLVCAKTRVAPIKPVSIPRLELCGAVLLARTFHKIASIYKCPHEQCTAYCDSTIVLTWLSQPPRTWKTFVSNRVAEITSLMPSTQWRHVNSQYNSADIASRGASVESLINSTLWWNPTLPPPTSSFSTSSVQKAAFNEARKPKVFTLVTTIGDELITNLLIERFSFTKLIRVFAYVLRAVERFKDRKKKFPLCYPSVMELVNSRDHIIRHVQNEAFPETLLRLRENRPLKKRDKLNPLAPILDNKGILRVGGRLPKSLLSYDQKHQMLLPSKSPFTEALIESTHWTNLHSGNLLTIAILRQQYWIINARDTVRRVLRFCHVCKRFNAKNGIQQPTGDLPAERVTPSRPFASTGIDFGGPIDTKYSSSKAKITHCKSYIALFVCLATKAIHLELVSDLTTEAFLAALNRFISRRGRPTAIFSDNGTNFVGASRKLQAIDQFLQSSEFDEKIRRHLADDSIQWHFIPPSAPNFGGIWEAGIKSAKRLLIPTLKSALLTFEEVYTILVQVEGCLNSRPLTAISVDPNDTEMLTPAHFLVGESLKTSPTLSDIPDHLSLTKRWKITQTVTKQFWTKWSREYLTYLQTKAKTTPPTPIAIDSIVLVKDEHSTPLQWPLARVIQVHPGKDGIVRVATVKTAKGSFKRPVSKLVIMPSET